MNRLSLQITILFLLSATCAYADGVSIFNIKQSTLFVSPNDGSGDNVGFLLTGPGTSISGFGGIGCFDWCSPFTPPFAPGSSPLVDIGQIFLGGFDNVTLGGHTFDPNTMAFGGNSFSASILQGFTFPVNPSASTFTTCVPAAMPSSLPGSVGSGSDFTNFVLHMPTSGNFCSTWVLVPGSGEISGGYQFSGGRLVTTAVPEPGTFGLMASGVAAVIAAIRRKHNCSPKRVSSAD
jgi:PEP-CTERM motif-containing protein